MNNHGRKAVVVHWCFSFGVLPSKYSGSAWGFNADSAKRKSVFLGERIFRFASADFPPAGGVWGGMRAGFISNSFGKNSAATKLNNALISVSIILCPKISNSNMLSIYGK